MAQISSNLPWDLMNPRLAAILNPLLAKAIFSGNEIKGISLVSGSNSINHGLGQPYQGWIITDVNAGVTIYSEQSTRPDLTLVLNSSGTATINLYVY